MDIDAQLNRAIRDSVPSSCLAILGFYLQPMIQLKASIQALETLASDDINLTFKSQNKITWYRIKDHQPFQSH